MRISPLRARAAVALAFTAAFLCGAPSAEAQQLIPFTGQAVPYRVSLPAEGWQIRRADAETLTAGTTDAMMILTAWDLLAREPAPAGVSVESHRRAITDRYMSSDSLLTARIDQALAANGGVQEGQVREIRTLGGQRAVYAQARWVPNGTGWSKAYVTVKDGFMYMLLFVLGGGDADRHSELLDRVHQSVELAETPPA